MRKLARPIVLGINSAYHESAAALVSGDQVEFSIEEERITRVKHGKLPSTNNPDELPFGAIKSCLEGVGLSSVFELDAIAYSLVPGERLRMIDIDPYEVRPESGFGTLKGEFEFNNRVLAIPRIFACGSKKESDHSPRFHFVPHHLAHAAMAFYCSPFEKAAVLVVDGIGESATTWLGHGSSAGLIRLEEIPYPHSIGLLWERVAVYLGFSEYDACKVMGLAAYGDPHRFRPEMDRLFFIQDENGTCGNSKRPFYVDPFFSRIRAGDVAGLEMLFGPARLKSESPMAPRFVDLAAALQRRTEEVLIMLSRRLARTCGELGLAYAGGVALNCVANARIERDGVFKEIYIPGAAHDAGTAVGAAIQVAEQINPGGFASRVARTSTPFLGPSFDAARIDAAIRLKGDRAEKVTDPDVRAARLLADGAIVGWFQGRMELGPRALGHRSLLADPRREDMRHKLNDIVKHRENFRPFAASVLAEAVLEWFELPSDSVGAAASRHLMLFAYKVKPQRAVQVPAILHVDLTSRIQTVHREHAPMFHRLISAFRDITGVPMILNTSFNDQEPIVLTPEDALNTFRQSRIDALFLGDRLVHRPQ